jgi:hypothetical protein
MAQVWYKETINGSKTEEKLKTKQEQTVTIKPTSKTKAENKRMKTNYT